MLAPVAPTLTAKTTPGPGVEVYFPTLDALGATITVWRVADGEREEVQGAKRATASGDFVVTDWSVPFGVSSTYVGELFDASGASVLGASSAVQVDSDEVYISNPIDPEQVFTVELQAASMQNIERSTNNQKVYVMGVPRPFNQFWGEGAIVGLPLEVFSYNSTETTEIKSITSWPQLLIRTPTSFETLPRLLYAAVQRSSHKYLPKVGDDPDIIWSLTVDEVQPIGKAIIRPLITWDDWIAAFPPPATWNDVMAVYAAGTWTNAQRVGP